MEGRITIVYFCLEKHFNLSIDFCFNIENHTKDDIYGDVEEEVEYNSDSLSIELFKSVSPNSTIYIGICWVFEVRIVFECSNSSQICICNKLPY